MHAVLVKVSIKEGQEDAAVQALQDRIVPMVSQAPGFVAGYWLEPEDGTGGSMVLFDSEEAARAVAETVSAGPDDPVVIETVKVRAIAANA